MMASERDMERFFEELGYTYDILGPQMWQLETAAAGGFTKFMVSFSPPLVVLRLKVVDLPAKGDVAKIMRLLLEANAGEVVHGAFGLEGNAIVLVDTLEADYMDPAELQASVDGMTFAAATIIPRLKNAGIR